MDRIAASIPARLARPLSALATLVAIGGAALFFHSAAFGQYHSAIWGTVAFLGAGLLWYAGDIATGNRPID
jgi:hypothetical protein